MNGTLLLCISILLLTSFVKVLTCMGLLRYGLGFYSFGFEIVFFALSLAISLYIISPQIGSIDNLLKIESYEEVQEKFKPFMEKNISDDLKDKFLLEKNTQDNKSKDDQEEQEEQEDIKIKEKKDNIQYISFLFLVSELRDALKYGVMILIPFLIIDILVMNIFMSLGIKSISYSLVSLPIKLMLFVSVDGLVIVVDKIIKFYV